MFAAKVLRGATPPELPVIQPSIFELPINLNTSNAVGLTMPPRGLHAFSCTEELHRRIEALPCGRRRKRLSAVISVARFAKAVARYKLS
jgi:hypothetical protein